MSDAPAGGLPRAVVARVDFGGCVLRAADGSLFAASVAGRLRGPRKSLGNAVVVGDRVGYEPGRSDGREAPAVVAEVDPRRNAFSRRAPGRDVREQVVAANVDQVIVVTALAEPEFSAGLVDRVLVQSARAGIPARLVVNKLDLGDERGAGAILADYRSAGIEGHALSAKRGVGLEPLHAALRGRRSLFVGHSGVGKSSLLNALEPDFALLAGEVNARTGKGRHTTTAAVLLHPEPGVEMIDTPGMRAFGLWGIEPDTLAQWFVEFAPHLSGCRFADCSHVSEPGCALRAAVQSGAVTRRRFDSFLKLREELRDEAPAFNPRKARSGR